MSVDSWIDGAQRTHHSVTLYQRADLVAELDDISRRLDLAKASPDSSDELEELTGRWVTIGREFTASAMTVTVKGLTAAEVASIRAEAVAGKADEREQMARIISAAVVDPPLAPDQVLRLEDAVGENQLALIIQAWQAASQEPPPLIGDNHG